MFSHYQAHHIEAVIKELKISGVSKSSSVGVPLCSNKGQVLRSLQERELANHTPLLQIIALE